MPKGKNTRIATVEQELDYMNRVWNKMDTLEKVVVLTVTFLYFYLIIVVLASYNSLSKSAEPTAGKTIFGLMVATAAITMVPVAAHYMGISTYGVIHIIGLVGVATFVAALWLLFESFDKRELDTSAYKDPYTMALYFLLISFSVIYVVGSISRKL
jgi:hypothetical protein